MSTLWVQVCSSVPEFRLHAADTVMGLMWGDVTLLAARCSLLQVSSDRSKMGLLVVGQIHTRVLHVLP